ncbi:MarR family winged helix-turn-helix transcriptional regulator [Herbiconiux sp. P15]|uniref:MarR family winged helix-turn-helix transcriptional regulator n=1 Tax=Herbiconiux liukaitaii TaxID=3342799 RepID=UPI0035BAE7A1
MNTQTSSTPELSALLSDLLSVTHRLTRLAAEAAASPTTGAPALTSTTSPNAARSVSPATWRTLSALSTFGPMRLGELAKQARVSQPAMSKIVANLNEVEWIRRIADVDDARAWQIALAPKGIRALAEWREKLDGALAPLFDGLDASEIETISRALDLLSECTDQQLEQAREGSALRVA